VECLLRCGNRQLPHHLAQGFSGSDLNRVYHCLLIETPASGVVLVDTDLGAQDFGDPAKRLGLAFTYGFGRPRRDPALIAGAQIRARTHDPRDVRHIVLTYMEFYHVGGLVDFPHARAYMSMPRNMQ